MQTQNNQHWTWAGLIAFVGFSLLVICLAALRPEYQHAHKAISELGAIGAPYMLVMNTFGFIGTGLLMAMFALGYRSTIGQQAAGYKALLLSALFFALSATPLEIGADSDPDYNSKFTIVHTAFAQLAPIPWLWALASIFFRYRKSAYKLLAIFSAIAFVAMIAMPVVGTLVFGSEAPGLTQRGMFIIFLGWYAIAAFLLRSARQSDL